MMRILFLSIFLAGLSFSVNAQTLSSFQNEIFKETKSNTPDRELHISDFSYQNQFASPNSILNIPRTKPGVAFAASALIPGTGQAFNGKWVRAGIYFTAEVVGVIYHLDRNATARRQEKAYEEFTHQNWSVLAYAQWLVQYSDANNISQARLDELRGAVYNENGRPLSPNWGNTPNDWSKVNIRLLRDVEAQTPFVFENKRSHNFSHALPDYGSQQYYELISKYYQYQPGWQDWYGAITTAENQNEAMYRYMWNGQDEPNGMFYEGRDRAQEFNDNYRVAGNILKLLLINHVVSAFDAFITVKLKNSRIETEANLMKMEQLSLTWHF